MEPSLHLLAESQVAGSPRVRVRVVGGGDPMDQKGVGVSGLMEKLRLSDNEKKGIKIEGTKVTI